MSHAPAPWLVRRLQALGISLDQAGSIASGQGAGPTFGPEGPIYNGNTDGFYTEVQFPGGSSPAPTPADSYGGPNAHVDDQGALVIDRTGLYGVQLAGGIIATDTYTWLDLQLFKILPEGAGITGMLNPKIVLPAPAVVGEVCEVYRDTQVPALMILTAGLKLEMVINGWKGTPGAAVGAAVYETSAWAEIDLRPILTA